LFSKVLVAPDNDYITFSHLADDPRDPYYSIYHDVFHDIMCLKDFDSGVNYCAGDDVHKEIMPICFAANNHLTEKQQSV